MTLRRKSLLILGAIAILMVALLYAGAWSLLWGEFARLEDQGLRQDVRRLLSALSHDIAELDRTVADWAHWDDTYRYVQGANPGYQQDYERANLVDDTFLKLRLRLLAIVDLNGRPLYSRAYDPYRGRTVELPRGLEPYLSAGGALLRYVDENSRVRGILALPDGVLLVASRPVLNSQGHGPPRGTLVMGRLLDAEEIEQLAGIAQVAVGLYPLRGDEGPPDVQVARTSLSAQAPVRVQRLSEEAIAGYALIEDIEHRPALIARVEIPRDVYRQGVRTVYHVAAWLLLIGLAFGAAVLWFSDRLVLARLARLAADIGHIGTRGDIAGRVSINGNDELTRLASTINATLGALEEAQSELRASKERYRSVIAAIGEGVLLQDAQGVILACNASAERILGIPSERLLGRLRSELRWHVIREDGSPFPEQAQPAAETLRTGQPRASVVMGIYRPDGRLAWVSMNSQPLLRPGESVPYAVVCSFADITAHKRAEERLRESEESYRLLADHSTDLISRHTPEGVFTYASPAAHALLGYAPEELMGHPSAEFVYPDDEGEVYSVYHAFAYVQPQGPPSQHTFSYRMRRKDGSYVWFETTSRAVQDPNTGTVREVVAISRDIGERRQAEEALRQANAKLTDWLRELAQRTRELTALADMGKRLQKQSSVEEAYAVIAKVLPALFTDEAGMFGIVVPGQNQVEVIASWGEEKAAQSFCIENCQALIRRSLYEVSIGSELPVCTYLHHAPPADYVCAPLLARDEVLGLLHLRSTAAAVEGIREARLRLAETVAEHLALSLTNLRLHQTLRSQSIRDPLTHLFNRRHMEESLDRELLRATRNRHSVGVIMLDLDHFKRCNDSFGHEAGDTALCAIAEFLRTHVRGQDIACRYGGEEFTLILPEAALENTLRRAEILCDGVRQLGIEHLGHPLAYITASFGVAVFPEHGLSRTDILRAADAALYQAKAQGRDRVVVASASSKPKTAVAV